MARKIEETRSERHHIMQNIKSILERINMTRLQRVSGFRNKLIRSFSNNIFRVMMEASSINIENEL